ncbi:MAG: metallophosphoesterase family protein [Desulfatibacillaceae bacterium]
MRIGIFSDIHGNAENLEIVLRELSGCDRLVCLGDLFGYDDPVEEVVDMLEDAGAVCLLGNHDLELLLGRSVFPDRFANGRLAEVPVNPLFADRLSDPCRSRVLEHRLAAVVREGEDTWHMVHSCLRRENGNLYFDYVGEDNAEAVFSGHSSEVVFLGHTHIPGVGVLERERPYSAQKAMRTLSFTPGPGQRLVVNAGSVGKPRIPGMTYSYAVLDTITHRITLVVA